MSVADWQQRVIDEKRALDERRAALVVFLRSEKYEALDRAEQSRLNAQLACMDGYSRILRARISAWSDT